VTNAFGFVEHDIIRETNDFDPKTSQMLGPSLVIADCSFFEVLAAIELDRQTARWTIKI
jgi:hypothetical protein